MGEDRDISAGYAATFLVGWGDVDALGHMANTAYLNKAADVRLKFLASHGFTQSELFRLGVVPIARRDEIDYYREFLFHEDLRVDFQLGGLSDDGSNAHWVNHFYRGERLAARVTTLIGFLDMKERRLTVPPDELVASLRALARTEEFAILPSVLRT